LASVSFIKQNYSTVSEFSIIIENIFFRES
jgi:hypothetical protein